MNPYPRSLNKKKPGFGLPRFLGNDGAGLPAVPTCHPHGGVTTEFEFRHPAALGSGFPGKPLIWINFIPQPVVFICIAFALLWTFWQDAR